MSTVVVTFLSGREAADCSGRPSGGGRLCVVCLGVQGVALQVKNFDFYQKFIQS